MQHDNDKSCVFPRKTAISGYPGVVFRGFENQAFDAFFLNLCVNFQGIARFSYEKQPTPLKPENGHIRRPVGLQAY